MYTRKEIIFLKIILKRIVVKEYFQLLPEHIGVQKHTGAIWLIVYFRVTSSFTSFPSMSYEKYTQILCETYGLKDVQVITYFSDMTQQNIYDYIIYNDFSTTGELKPID